MANVVCHDNKRSFWVVLSLSEPVDPTRPREDQTDQVPGKITEDAVTCPFLDRHLTLSHLANYLACRLGILRSNGRNISIIETLISENQIRSVRGEWNNDKRELVTVNGIASRSQC